MNQENDLGHCSQSKCQITAIFTFFDISKNGYYVALNASNVRYFTFKDHLKYHKIINLGSLPINNKISKIPILYHISANSHTCGSDAIAFVGFMSSLEVTLTVCHNLGLLEFCLPKIRGVDKFLVPIFSVLTIFEF